MDWKNDFYLILVQFLEIFFDFFSPTIKQSNRKKKMKTDEKQQEELFKEWTGKTMYLDFSSIFGDFFLKFFSYYKAEYRVSHSEECKVNPL